MTSPQNGTHLRTRILPVRPSCVDVNIALGEDLEGCDLDLDWQSQDACYLRGAAAELQQLDIPVAFPTETVYGLGADATRSSAVRSIYAAKQRPPDNPLIVHVNSLVQLRQILSPSPVTRKSDGMTRPELAIPASHSGTGDDPIPSVYYTLIDKFWPGPLTLIFPNPDRSSLAPEVTAGLSTFGARMPSNALALALITLSKRPLAAPSANASTKPSPTTAEHVKEDLDGRISTIIDGGPCEVGLESTVVDGLSSPPLILRPGGISLEQIQACPGWENTQVGYKDVSELKSNPKAPGMKYRHYSPRAQVVLFENGAARPTETEMFENASGHASVGIIRTMNWRPFNGTKLSDVDFSSPNSLITFGADRVSNTKNGSGESADKTQHIQQGKLKARKPAENDLIYWEIDLGSNLDLIAQGLFSALRELDSRQVGAILVEGIDDTLGDRAAAVMNRLRKAAGSYQIKNRQNLTAFNEQEQDWS